MIDTTPRTKIEPKPFDLVITIMFIICFLLHISGCSYKQDKRYSLNVSNGSGWDHGSSLIKCDSFQMISPKECLIWDSGVKQRIVCTDVIYVGNN